VEISCKKPQHTLAKEGLGLLSHAIQSQHLGFIPPMIPESFNLPEFQTLYATARTKRMFRERISDLTPDPDETESGSVARERTKLSLSDLLRGDKRRQSNGAMRSLLASCATSLPGVI